MLSVTYTCSIFAILPETGLNNQPTSLHSTCRELKHTDTPAPSFCPKKGWRITETCPPILLHFLPRLQSFHPGLSDQRSQLVHHISQVKYVLCYSFYIHLTRLRHPSILL